ncbi:hypothetical protein [Streptosporangium minutum]|uniref:Uncharacterized protein n=1 Tax=Streptosporangium minutum TaxID=569862 RepID=A0A243R8G2_9ACTN|nr:hypothetical protein [Streptosporangium minutum]OUC90873.1 hypothetical protein CA984_35885 [Streptosporangium minutum]
MIRRTRRGVAGATVAAGLALASDPAAAGDEYWPRGGGVAPMGDDFWPKGSGVAPMGNEIWPTGSG